MFRLFSLLFAWYSVPFQLNTEILLRNFSEVFSYFILKLCIMEGQEGRIFALISTTGNDFLKDKDLGLIMFLPADLREHQR